MLEEKICGNCAQKKETKLSLEERIKIALSRCESEVDECPVCKKEHALKPASKPMIFSNGKILRVKKEIKKKRTKKVS
jgi:hypothetical protein